MSKCGGSALRLQGVYGAMRSLPAVHEHIEGTQVTAGNDRIASEAMAKIGNIKDKALIRYNTISHRLYQA